MTQQQLKDFLAITIPNKLPVLITGAPGIGKTQIVKAAAKLANANLIISHPVVSDPTDYKGLPFKVEGANYASFMPFGELAALINAKELTVFFLDDLGQASPATQAACMQLILERRINGHKVSDSVVFIAATNRKSDKAGVTGILEPVKSRFNSIIELEVSVDDWCEWALTEGDIPVELVAFIRFRPELLHKFEPTKEIVNTPSPRTVAQLGKLQKCGIPEALRFEAFKGATGEGFASEYSGFLKMYEMLPTIDEILLNPDKVAVPAEPSQLYAISTALGSRIKDTTCENAFQYIRRMPGEFQAICAKDALRRNPQLGKEKSFQLWSVDNGNLIL